MSMREQLSFGRWLKQRRKSLDLTQEELGARVGCARITIQKFELDQRRPSQLMAERLAEQLAIPRSEFTNFIRYARAMPERDRVDATLHPLSSSTLTSSDQQSPTPYASAQFVGRTRELATLATQLDKARQGKGQVLFIAGDAGRGKTALIHEFSARMQNSDRGLLVVSGSCNAYSGIGDPYLPFREVLAQLAGEMETKPEASWFSIQQVQRLREVMPVVLPALVEHAPDLIGSLVPGEPLVERAVGFARADERWLQRLTRLIESEHRTQLDERRVFTQYGAMLKAITAQRLVLLILEDLQWIDAASASLLFYLSRAMVDCHILMVGTYRPDGLATWQGVEPHPLLGILGELKRQRGDILLDLEDVSHADARHFIDAYLDLQPNRLDDAFRDLILRRTGGNALFVVELLRTMQEKGNLRRDTSGCWTTDGLLDWDTLPAKVEGVVVQRIADLSPELQTVLAVASVEGELFTAEILARVLRRSEHEVIAFLSRDLDRQHQLVTAQSVTWVGTQRLSQYRFRHFLFQVYLYHHLDAIERAYWHEALGTSLELVYAAQTEQITVKLAHHFRHAGLTEKAVTYLLRAGEHAQQLGANQEAIQHVKQGLALLAALPDSALRAQQELALQIVLGNAFAAVHGAGAREVEATFLRAEALCRKVGSTEQLLATLDGLRGHYTMRTELTRAKLIAHEMLHAAQSQPNPTHHVAANLALGNICGWLGEFTAARMYLEQAIPLYDMQHSLAYRGVYGRDLGVGCLTNLGVMLWILGFPEQALQCSRDALDLAQTLEHPVGLANAHAWAAQLHWLRHEPQEAQRQAEIAIPYAAKQNRRLWWAMSLGIRGMALMEQGQVEDGMHQIRQALDAYRKLGSVATTAFYLTGISSSYAIIGQVQEAMSVLSEALANVETGEHQTWAAEVYRLKGELLLEQWRSAEHSPQSTCTEAEASLSQAIETARAQQAKSFELRATISLCRLWQAQGKRAEAHALLAKIYGWFTEGFDTVDLMEAKALLEISV